MPTSYGQVNGRRSDGVQRAFTPEDAERARVAKWFGEKPGRRVCYVLGGRLCTGSEAALAMGFDRAGDLDAAYAEGPLWYRGRVVRRYVR